MTEQLDEDASREPSEHGAGKKLDLRRFFDDGKRRLEPWLVRSRVLGARARAAAARVVGGKDGRRFASKRSKRILFTVALAALCGITLLLLQETGLRFLGDGVSYRPGRGSNGQRVEAPRGPYDLRHGYATLPDMIDSLEDSGFEVARETRAFGWVASLFGVGVFPIFHEKPAAGLVVESRRGLSMYRRQFPSRTFLSFGDVPPLVRNTLLFIENRELLKPGLLSKNPALEWRRMGRALVSLTLDSLGVDVKVPGGSTLATQLEKLRHSSGGRTTHVWEKARQITSASLRAFRGGDEQNRLRERILLDYINSIPLAATRGHGEVAGLADGLWAWYGVHPEQVIDHLAMWDASQPPGPVTAEVAMGYRQVLSLLLSVRQPTRLLRRQPKRLARLADEYLPLLADAGVISPQLRDASLATRVVLRRRAPKTPPISFAARRASDSVRVDLLRNLGIRSLQDLDKLDLRVRSTIDAQAQADATDMLQSLGDPKELKALGLARLLRGPEPSRVRYSVTMYEAAPRSNVLRVMADNSNTPFNISEQMRLDLGSTAKLRTFVHYLEIISDLHAEYAEQDEEELEEALEETPREDRLRRWAIRYLSRAQDRALAPMLTAAKQRTYSASPNEQFFTGGAPHTFSNFSGMHNSAFLTVEAALRSSVNLVFIRLMRDIVYHYRTSEAREILADANHPRREAYLVRAIEAEAESLQNKYYQRYADLDGPTRVLTLVMERRLSARRLAVALRSVVPSGVSYHTLANWLSPERDITEPGFRDAFEKADVEELSWQDRGHLARIHPIELWTVHYLLRHPDASLAQLKAESLKVYHDANQWLQRTRNKGAQNTRIATLIERDAFIPIAAAWQRLGYPFARLVPSYATSLGCSGDRPEALAELMGILLRDGKRYPVLKISELQFAAGTPYETVLRPELPKPEVMIDPAVAKSVREALVGVVRRGTASRLHRAFGTVYGDRLPVGGKTGTGDHRRVAARKRGGKSAATAVSRSATFVFFIGDRFYGTITAFVTGEEAGDYRFTSSLSVEILRVLEPAIVRPLS